MSHPPRHNTPSASAIWFPDGPFFAAARWPGRRRRWSGLLAGSAQAATKTPPPIDPAVACVSEGIGRRNHRVGARASGTIARRHGAEHDRHHADHARRQLPGPVDARLRHVVGLRADRPGRNPPALAADRSMPKRRAGATLAERRASCRRSPSWITSISPAGRCIYPGTYSSGEDQGAPPLWPAAAGGRSFLLHPHRLRAVARYGRREVPRRDDRRPQSARPARTGVSFAGRRIRKPARSCPRKERRAVGFGFQDSVYLLGAMSFATLLRYRAARQLAESVQGRRKGRGGRGVYGERPRRSPPISRRCSPIRRSATDGCWRRPRSASSRTFGQRFSPCIWEFCPPRRRRGPAIPWRRPSERRGTRSNTRARFVTCRPIATSARISAGKRAAAAVNTYQSGAFWHTPTGWLIEALQAVDPTLARAGVRSVPRAICASAIFARAKAAVRRGSVSGSTWPARRIPST